MSKSLCKFFPVHSESCVPVLRAGQRYRHPFNDKRLTRRTDATIDLICRHRSQRIDGISLERKDGVATSRLLANDRVCLSELISYCCDIPADRIESKRLLVAGDGSSVNMNLRGHGLRTQWAKSHSCLANSKVAGFQFMAGLVLDQSTHDIIGVSDMVLYDSPRDFRSKKSRHTDRYWRLQLPLQQRESGAWSILADNSMSKLSLAQQVTFVFDREADSYENMAYLGHRTAADFIIRQKYNRKAKTSGGKEEKVGNLLAHQPWVDFKTVKITALNHRVRKGNRKRKRQKRKAKLKIRYIQLMVSKPQEYHKHHSDRPAIEQPLYLVEVQEDESTVPKGEKPIHWRLWTSWKVESAEMAWEVIDAYRARWNVEQLFRLLKTDGINLEISQLNHPDRIKRLLIMTTKACAEALRLVQARDGKHFIEIGEMFDNKEQALLEKLNSKLSKKDTATVNPHAPESLAFAAWVVARLGGWNGYASQRPPGPIKMHRGLQEFYKLLSWAELLNDS